MAQPENFVLESRVLNSEALTQIEKLQNILIELNILNSTKSTLSPEEVPIPSLRQDPQTAYPLGTTKEGHFCDSGQRTKDKGLSSSQSMAPDQNLADSDDPLQRLQNLLTAPELAKCPDIIVELEQKLATIEHQMYDGTLSNVLLPMISELMNRQVAESMQSVARAIASIIDEVIQKKTEEDREAMGAAIALAIPAAISQQVQNFPDEIGNAIAPDIAAAVKKQINIQQDAMADALYPVIGSTISKYLAEEIRAINQKVETALSPEGITRKLRAKMQGVSEAELILKEAMPCTVRAIFLIHKCSGLVISEEQPGSEKLESEMVAGMLTAIRSFVNDCIAQSGNVSEIDAIEYGNSKIILEVAGYCYLAVVVQGEPSQWFILKMRQTLSTIVQSYGKSIELFEGDPATIPEQVKLNLEALRHTPSKVKASRPPGLLILSSVLLSLILIPWGFFQYRNATDRRIEQDTASALTSAPELSIYNLAVDVNQGNLKLSGRVPNQYLRTKAEQIAKSAAPKLKLNNQILAVEVPADPVLAASEVKRVTSILNQMDGVAIASRYAERLVTVEGTVTSFANAQKITRSFQQIPGVQAVTNTVRVQTPPTANRIYFDFGSTALTPTGIQKIIQLKEFLNQNPRKHLKIIGHSDFSGNRKQNQHLALQRAEKVRDALVARGIKKVRLQVVGENNNSVSVDSLQPLWLSRYVEFQPLIPKVRK